MSLKFLRNLGGHLGLMAFSGLILGFWGGDYVLFTSKLLSAGLFVILFLGAIKTPLASLGKHFLSGWGIYLSLAKLILMPLVVFALVMLLNIPEIYLPGLVLLAASPAAVASPGLISALNGNVSLGFVVTIITNFLTPFTMPFLLAKLVGVNVEFDVISMMLFLSGIIFGPFLLAEIGRRLTPKLIDHVQAESKSYMAVLLFIFGVGVMAPHQKFIIQNIDLAWKFLVLVFIFALFLIFIGYLLASYSNQKNIATSIITIAFFNAGLAVVIATKYLDVHSTMMAVFYELPWAFLLIPTQKFFKKNI